MVRRKDIEAEINGYLKALSEKGFPFEKAVLFGSMPKEIRMNTAILTSPFGALHLLMIILPLLKK